MHKTIFFLIPIHSSTYPITLLLLFPSFSPLLPIFTSSLPPFPNLSPLPILFSSSLHFYIFECFYFLPFCLRTYLFFSIYVPILLPSVFFPIINPSSPPISSFLFFPSSLFLYLPSTYFLSHRFLLPHFLPSSSNIIISPSLFCPSTFPPSFYEFIPFHPPSFCLFFALLRYLSTSPPSSYLFIPPSLSCLPFFALLRYLSNCPPSSYLFFPLSLFLSILCPYFVVSTSPPLFLFIHPTLPLPIHSLPLFRYLSTFPLSSYLFISPLSSYSLPSFVIFLNFLPLPI